jgi:lysophospholipase L1-like esterase
VVGVRIVGLLVVVAAAVVALVVRAVADQPRQQPHPAVYLALGDSLAAGDQPDAHGIDHPTTAGYANVLARRLGLRLVNLSCGGATTGTLLRGGGSCERGGPGQLALAEAYAAQNPGEVALITVNVGDNDVERCVHFNPPGVDVPCVARGRQSIGRNLPQIAQRLRAAAGPDALVVGIADYDQYLALWNDPGPGHALAVRSLHIVTSMNQLMARIYTAAGLLVADAGRRFATGDPPVAVRRICRWTWACSGPPIGHDDHANAAGYAQIAGAVEDALRNASATSP